MFRAPINAYGPGVHIGKEPEPILPELAQQDPDRVPHHDIPQAVKILADGFKVEIVPRREVAQCNFGAPFGIQFVKDLVGGLRDLPTSLASDDNSIGEILAIGNPQHQGAYRMRTHGGFYAFSGPSRKLYVAQDDTSVGKLSILLVGCHAEHVSQGFIRADAVEVAARLA
jgi:hypothetical protein